jgi:23S rRNA pseudouridine1911/1915/1917 synthase
VPDEADGIRLDRFLASRMKGHTRSAIRKLIDDDRVLVDGAPPRKAGMLLSSGMEIVVDVPRPPDDTLLPEEIPLEIEFEDDHLLVVRKPAGLVVHPGHANRTGTMVNGLLGRGTSLSRIGAPDRPGIVHRLDRDTSGLLVVARTDEAHLALASAFARREVVKVYHALVWGHPDPAEGVVDRSIGRSRRNRTAMSVRAPRGRRAVTRYAEVERMPGFSLLRIDLKTGRTHQIRVHLQSIHHPVVGDDRYGGRQWKGVQDTVKRNALRQFRRLALHASELGFRHPSTGEELRFRSELPGEIRSLLEVLRRTT